MNELREATHKVIGDFGVGILSTSKRFVACLTDIIDIDSAEAHVLHAVCGDAFLSIYADAAESATPEALSGAAARAAELLSGKYTVDPQVAQSLSLQIAQGIGDALGVEVPNPEEPGAESSVQEARDVAAGPKDGDAGDVQTVPVVETASLQVPEAQVAPLRDRKRNKVLVGVAALAVVGIALVAALAMHKSPSRSVDTQASKSKTEARISAQEEEVDEAPEEVSHKEEDTSPAVERAVYRVQEELISSDERAVDLEEHGVDLSALRKLARSGLQISTSYVGNVTIGEGDKGATSGKAGRTVKAATQEKGSTKDKKKNKAEDEASQGNAYDVAVSYEGADINQALKDAVNELHKSGKKGKAQKVIDNFVSKESDAAKESADGEIKQGKPTTKDSKNTCRIVVDSETPTVGKSDETYGSRILQGKNGLFEALATAMSLPLDQSSIALADAATDYDTSELNSGSVIDDSEQFYDEQGQSSEPSTGSTEEQDDDEYWDDEEYWDDDSDESWYDSEDEYYEDDSDY